MQVFVWEDRDEDDVKSYKTLEGHKSDILAMAAYAPRQLLATGERVFLRLACEHVHTCMVAKERCRTAPVAVVGQRWHPP